jgi:7-keto-8-aminopelargonate synthetase-like enzyme
VEISDALLKKGFFVPAVRFPTVAKGSARLRISVNTDLSIESIQFLSVIKEIGI